MKNGGRTLLIRIKLRIWPGILTVRLQSFWIPEIKDLKKNYKCGLEGGLGVMALEHV